MDSSLTPPWGMGVGGAWDVCVLYPYLEKKIILWNLRHYVPGDHVTWLLNELREQNGWE